MTSIGPYTLIPMQEIKVNPPRTNVLVFLFQFKAMLRQSGLHQTDIDCALTGGCIRDLYHGVDYKDVDIAFWGLPKKPWNVIALLAEEIEKLGFRRAERPEDATKQPSDADADRVDSVITFESGCGETVDVLFYSHQHHTLKDVLDSHDHTISQFAAYLDRGNEVRYVYRNSHFMGKCHRLRDNVSAERIQRVWYTSQKLGWQYVG